MAMTTQGSKPEPFDWPPKAQQPDPSPTPRPPAISIRLPNRMIESIETDLLGRTALGFGLWAQRSGWQRDRQTEYCWRCGGSLGKHESDGEGCASCRSKPLPWDRAIRLGRHDGILRDEVLALKFGRWRATGAGLGEHLGLAIGEQLKLAQIHPEQAVLVPVPMHRIRRLTRGIDHTTVLARAAARLSGCRICPMLRTRYRPEQVGLSMTARARNIKDAFSFSNRYGRVVFRKKTPSVRVVVLIDDVRTTGATFVAATKALKAGFKDGLSRKKVDQTGQIVDPMVWVASIGVAGEKRRKLDESGDMEVESAHG